MATGWPHYIGRERYPLGVWPPALAATIIVIVELIVIAAVLMWT